MSPKLAAVDFLGWGMGRPGRGVIGSEHRGGGTRSSGVRRSVDLSGRVGSTSDNDNEAATAEADSMATESPATTTPATA